MLVERDRQVAALRAVAASDAGRLVLVGAEAGAGKTALVRTACDEILASGRGPVLWGTCDSLRTARPWGPVRDWARRQSTLADLLRGETTPAAVLEGVLAELARTRAFAVVEDAHWADDATVDLLLFVGRRIASTGAALVVTYRAEDVRRGSALALALGDLATTDPVRIDVPPLSPEGVEALARAGGHDVDAAALLDRTAGNAFFVTECLASPGEVPATVREAVMSRLQRLPGPAVAAAEATAVFPGGAGRSRLAAVGADLDAVDRCLDDGLLVLERGRILFRHELARLAVAESMRAADRRRLHAVALHLLEAEQEPDEALMVHHALEAGDTAALLRHTPLAASRAESAGARREAIAHLKVTLQVGGGLPADEQVALLERLGALLDEIGDHDRSVAAYDRAVALTDDPREAARLGLRAWNPLSMAGRLTEASTRLDSAIEVLESLPPGAELALAYAQRCSLLMLSRRLRAAPLWGDRAMRLATESGDARTLAYAQIQSGVALFMTGVPGGLERVEAGIDGADGIGAAGLVAHGLSQVGCGGGEIRQYDGAVPALRRCVDYAERHQVHGRGSYAQAWLGRCLLEVGEWDEADRALTAVLATPRSTGVTRLTALTALGRLRARRGGADPWGPLDEAWTMARSIGHLQRTWPVAAARAEAAWLDDILDREVPLVLEVLAQAVDLDQPWATGELALWLQRAGHDLPELDATAVAPPYALALAGRPREASAAWRDLGCRYESADALAHGDDDRDQLAALATWREIGALPAVQRLVALRRAGGRSVPRGPRATTRASAAGLTVRELEVLDLLVEGFSNAEIAVRTHLSVKTVGHHVSHILAKLQVANRTEAARAAARLGLVPLDRTPR